MRHGRPSNRWRQESPSLESLELRLLLTQTPLAITAPRDAVFDPSRGLLYVTTGSGSVGRYDLATGTFLAPWAVGTSLNGADITPDGSALYVAEGQQTADSKCVVHKVDLATGHVTDLTFAHVDAYEQGTSDVAIAADGNAYVTIDWYSSYHTGSLAVIDMASGVVTRSNRLFDEYHTDIARSADRTRLAVGRPSAGVRVFNVLTQTVTANGYGSYQASYNGEASVSRDGRLIATPALNFGMSIVTDTGAPIINLAPELGISAFDPARDRFYVALSTGVTAYDTNTWKSIYTVPARILGGGYSPIGRMTVDAGGTRLAVVSPSDNQVELIDLPVPDGVAAKLEMAGYPPLAITGRPETFTVTVRDAAGNVATGYRGTVSFGTADVAATLPAPYTFTAQDAGTKTFSLTFRTPTYQTITVTDAAAGLTAPKSVISVHRPSPFQTLDNLSPTGTYDPVHRLLYLADYGGVRRYDPVAQRMLPTIDLDGFPATTLDVTPDGRYLYLGTSYRSMNNGWLLRVDLDTLAVARLPFALQRDDEAGIRSLAVASNGRVIFNTSADSANSYGYVRDYDPATGTFTLRLDILFNASLEKRSVLSRSADHGVVFIGDAYGNSRGVYDAATNHITYYS
ncbi:MAG: Hemolysin-type calcium-binding region, partial [Phycisphaerales bacterium]|nr:Hemolysin-type calcium-binding region [Phycisphaerales bacterium]